jgi:predicted ATPase
VSRGRLPSRRSPSCFDEGFQPGLTILVGENGSGKSTVVEPLAEAYGLNPQGGSVLVRYRGRITEPGIGRRLELQRGRLDEHAEVLHDVETG